MFNVLFQPVIRVLFSSLLLAFLYVYFNLIQVPLEAHVSQVRVKMVELVFKLVVLQIQRVTVLLHGEGTVVKHVNISLFNWLPMHCPV